MLSKIGNFFFRPGNPPNENRNGRKLSNEDQSLINMFSQNLNAIMKIKIIDDSNSIVFFDLVSHFLITFHSVDLDQFKNINDSNINNNINNYENVKIIFKNYSKLCIEFGPTIFKYTDKNGPEMIFESLLLIYSFFSDIPFSEIFFSFFCSILNEIQKDLSFLDKCKLFLFALFKTSNFFHAFLLNDGLCIVFSTFFVRKDIKKFEKIQDFFIKLVFKTAPLEQFRAVSFPKITNFKIFLDFLDPFINFDKNSKVKENNNNNENRNEILILKNACLFISCYIVAFLPACNTLIELFDSMDGFKILNIIFIKISNVLLEISINNENRSNILKNNINQNEIKVSLEINKDDVNLNKTNHSIELKENNENKTSFDVAYLCYEMLLVESNIDETVLKNMFDLFQDAEANANLRCSLISLLSIQTKNLSETYQKFKNVAPISAYIKEPPFLNFQGLSHLASIIKTLLEKKIISIHEIFDSVLSLISIPNINIDDHIENDSVEKNKSNLFQDIPYSIFLDIIFQSLESKELKINDLITSKFLQYFIFEPNPKSLAYFYFTYPSILNLIYSVYISNVYEVEELRFVILHKMILVSVFLESKNIKNFIKFFMKLLDHQFSPKICQLLSNFINEPHIIKILSKVMRKRIEAYDYFVESNGFTALDDLLNNEKQQENINENKYNSVIELIASLTYFYQHSEVDDWINEQSIKSPLFNLPREFLSQVAFGSVFQNKDQDKNKDKKDNKEQIVYKVLHVPSLLPFCDDFECRLVLNLYLAGKYGISACLKRGIPINNIPHISLIANRYVTPTVVHDLFHMDPFRIAEFVDTNQPQFSLFEIIPNIKYQKPAFITFEQSNLAAISFWYRVPFKSSEKFNLMSVQSLSNLQNDKLVCTSNSINNDSSFNSYILSLQIQEENLSIFSKKDKITYRQSCEKWHHIVINFHLNNKKNIINQIEIIIDFKERLLSNNSNAINPDNHFVLKTEPQEMISSFIVFGDKNKLLPVPIQISKSVLFSTSMKEGIFTQKKILDIYKKGPSDTTKKIGCTSKTKFVFDVHYLGFAAYYNFNKISSDSLSLFSLIEKVNTIEEFKSLYSVLLNLKSLRNYHFSTFWFRVFLSLKRRKDIVKNELSYFILHKNLKSKITKAIYYVLSDYEFYFIFPFEPIKCLLDKIVTEFKTEIDWKFLDEYELITSLLTAMRCGVDTRIIKSFIPLIKILLNVEPTTDKLRRFMNAVMSIEDFPKYNLQCHLSLGEENKNESDKSKEEEEDDNIENDEEDDYSNDETSDCTEISENIRGNENSDSSENKEKIDINDINDISEINENNEDNNNISDISDTYDDNYNKENDDDETSENKYPTVTFKLDNLNDNNQCEEEDDGTQSIVSNSESMSEKLIEKSGANSYFGPTFIRPSFSLMNTDSISGFSASFSSLSSNQSRPSSLENSKSSFLKKSLSNFSSSFQMNRIIYDEPMKRSSDLIRKPVPPPTDVQIHLLLAFVESCKLCSDEVYTLTELLDFIIFFLDERSIILCDLIVFYSFRNFKYLNGSTISSTAKSIRNSLVGGGVLEGNGCLSYVFCKFCDNSKIWKCAFSILSGKISQIIHLRNKNVNKNILVKKITIKRPVFLPVFIDMLASLAAKCAQSIIQDFKGPIIENGGNFEPNISYNENENCKILFKRLVNIANNFNKTQLALFAQNANCVLQLNRLLFLGILPNSYLCNENNERELKVWSTFSLSPPNKNEINRIISLTTSFPNSSSSSDLKTNPSPSSSMNKNENIPKISSKNTKSIFNPIVPENLCFEAKAISSENILYFPHDLEDCQPLINFVGETNLLELFVNILFSIENFEKILLEFVNASALQYLNYWKMITKQLFYKILDKISLLISKIQKYKVSNDDATNNIPYQLFKVTISVIYKYLCVGLFVDKHYIKLLKLIFKVLRTGKYFLHVFLMEEKYMKIYKDILIFSFNYIYEKNEQDILFELLSSNKELIINEYVFNDDINYQLFWLHIMRSHDIGVTNNDSNSRIKFMSLFMANNKINISELVNSYAPSEVEQEWVSYYSKKLHNFCLQKDKNFIYFNENEIGSKINKMNSIIETKQRMYTEAARHELFAQIYRTANFSVEQNLIYYFVNIKQRKNERSMFRIIQNEIKTSLNCGNSSNNQNTAIKSYHLSGLSYPVCQSRALSPSPFEIRSPEKGVKTTPNYFELNFQKLPQRIPVIHANGLLNCSPEWCFFNSSPKQAIYDSSNSNAVHKSSLINTILENSDIENINNSDEFTSAFEYSEGIEQGPYALLNSFKDTFNEFGNYGSDCCFDTTFLFYIHPIPCVLFLTERALLLVVLAKGSLQLISQPESPVAFLPFTESVALGEFSHSSLFCGHIVLISLFEEILKIDNHYYLHKPLGLIVSSLGTSDIILIFKNIKELNFVKKYLFDSIMNLKSSDKTTDPTSSTSSNSQNNDQRNMAIQAEMTNNKTNKRRSSFTHNVTQHVSSNSSINSNVVDTLTKNALFISFPPSSLLLFSISSVSEATLMWKNNMISNFDYLLLLNSFGGRSFNDLSQFPVVPWIHNPISKNSDLRNLALPMGQINEARAKHFDQTFELSTPTKYFYGFHYSLPGAVFWFLMRTPPFTFFQWDLNDGWDNSQRLFSSFIDAFNSAAFNNPSDLKELIPALYQTPEVFTNISNIDLNVTENVVLPDWCNLNPNFFVENEEKVLNESQDIQKWIDLIFGYKQTGENAKEFKNLFLPSSYRNSSCQEMDMDEESYNSHVLNFGQCPNQLFFKSHPYKLTKKVIYNAISEIPHSPYSNVGFQWSSQITPIKILNAAGRKRSISSPSSPSSSISLSKQGFNQKNDNILANNGQSDMNLSSKEEPNSYTSSKIDDISFDTNDEEYEEENFEINANVFNRCETRSLVEQQIINPLQLYQYKVAPFCAEPKNNEQGNRKNGRFIALPEKTAIFYPLKCCCKTLFFSFNLELESVSLIDISTMKTIFTKYSFDFAFINSISISDDGFFMAISFSFGRVDIFQIIFSENEASSIPCNIKKFGSFSLMKMSCLMSSLLPQDYLCASLFVQEENNGNSVKKEQIIFIWNFSTQTKHRIIHFYDSESSIFSNQFFGNLANNINNIIQPEIEIETEIVIEDSENIIEENSKENYRNNEIDKVNENGENSANGYEKKEKETRNVTRQKENKLEVFEELDEKILDIRFDTFNGVLTIVSPFKVIQYSLNAVRLRCFDFNRIDTNNNLKNIKKSQITAMALLGLDFMFNKRIVVLGHSNGQITFLSVDPENYDFCKIGEKNMHKFAISSILCQSQNLQIVTVDVRGLAMMTDLNNLLDESSVVLRCSFCDNPQMKICAVCHLPLCEGCKMNGRNICPNCITKK